MSGHKGTSKNLLRGPIAALRGTRNPHVQTRTLRFLRSVRLAIRPLATVFRGTHKPYRVPFYKHRFFSTPL